MSHRSAPEDLALHGVRVLGFPTAARVADRYDLDRSQVEEWLLDFEAVGWVRRSTGGSTGWSMTDAGRAEGERRLAAELDRTGTRHAVTAAHQGFLRLNSRFGAACTDWQIRPTPLDPLALNDHTDRSWDERVLGTVRSVAQAFTELCIELAGDLTRFDGYAGRFLSALHNVDAGQGSWLDAPDRDSCHLVWIQFHEDLLATLGIPRGSDG